jgi:hypothetical protein
MLRRIEVRLRGPSPATAMSAIALFVSLGGVGYAAARIGSAQIKDNSVASKDIKNRTIRSKDISGSTVAALKGQTGAQGSKGGPGLTGPKGGKGDQGVPGPVTGVLPSGVTERGAFVVRDIAGAAFEEKDTAISFGLTLSTDVAAHYVSGAPTTACPGSAADPTAAPGNLCLYKTLTSNDNLKEFVDPATTLSTVTARPYGVLFRVYAQTIGDFYVYGTWAVTAP